MTPAKSTSAGLARVTAGAVVPEQLLPYLSAVSPLRPRAVGSCVALMGAGLAVLVGYPTGAPDDRAALDAAVNGLLATQGLARVTVLACAKPSAAPADAATAEDAYWALPLPLPAPGQKLRNMLRRGARETVITSASGAAAWTAEHEALAEGFIASHELDEGSVHIFRRVRAYLAAAPQALAFSARLGDGRLAACCVGDFSSLATAFYMFAFRAPFAPPGTADALVAALASEGTARGHSRLNLGLGISPGVAFFKKKWGAMPFLPYVETSWELRKKGLFSRLFGR